MDSIEKTFLGLVAVIVLAVVGALLPNLVKLKKPETAPPAAPAQPDTPFKLPDLSINPNPYNQSDSCNGPDCP